MTNNTTLQSTIQAVVLAAGQGSRLKTGITKMITPICGQPMVLYTIKLLEKLGIQTTVVIGYQKEIVQAAIEKANIPKIEFAEQMVQLGTGHALLASKKNWHTQTILVLNGDMPLIDAHTIEQLCKTHSEQKAAISIATSYNIDPANSFGRIVHANGIVKIVEKKHFTYAIGDYPQVNVGMYIIDRLFLENYADAVQQNNVTGEFYITDLVEIASLNKQIVITQEFPFDTFHGVNTFHELAHAEQIKHDELIQYWMAQGVRFIMPQTIHIDHNVTVGKGTVVYPGVQLFNGSTIGEFCAIKSQAVLDGASIPDRTTINAFALIEGPKTTASFMHSPKAETQNAP